MTTGFDEASLKHTSETTRGKLHCSDFAGSAQ